jgi:hypothetical protein
MLSNRYWGVRVIAAAVAPAVIVDELVGGCEAAFLKQRHCAIGDQGTVDEHHWITGTERFELDSRPVDRRERHL